jgi:hypothetical protein
VVAAALLSASGCETVKTTSQGAVGVDRKQQMLVSEESIEQGAAQAYEAELKTARDKGVLNTDKAQLARVTTIAKRLVAATPAFRQDATGWNWQFNAEDQGAERVLHAGRPHHGDRIDRAARSLGCGTATVLDTKSRMHCVNTRASASRAHAQHWCCQVLPRSQA